MKATILGSGSAYGVPTIGDYWGKCDPSNPKNKRTAASIMIESGQGSFLIDFGPDIKEQSLKTNIRDIDALFFTHAHADHIAGCFHLPMFMKFFTQQQNLPMYADRATRKDIEKVWHFQNDPKIDIEYSGTGRPYWVEMLPHQQIKIKDMDVQVFHQNHGSINSMGFRVGGFAYSTDMRTIPLQSMKYLHHLDHWVIDCNCLEQTTMHGDLGSVQSLINTFNPTNVYLTHLDHSMDYDTISAMLPKNVKLCYDGMEIEF